VTFAGHLTAQLEQCTAEDWREGAGFYPALHRSLAEVADYYGFPLAPVVGAFAILSPRNTLDGNLRSLVTCLAAIRRGMPAGLVPVTTLNRNRDTAFQILTGEADFGDLVEGVKVTAFRHNILFPSSSDRITIDGHMVNLMTGEHRSMLDALLFMRQTGGYQEYERTFRRWARRHTTTGAICNLQAVVWTGWRRRIESAKVQPLRIQPAYEIQPYEFRGIA
jgi:hypothetical protein